MSTIYIPRPSVTFACDPFGPSALLTPEFTSPQTAVARSIADVVSAWRFVYQRYVANGLIAAHAYHLHTVPQAIRRGTTVITKDRGGRIQSTISCYVDGPEGLPLDAVYPEELAQARARSGRVGEIGLFAEDEDESCASTASDLLDFMRYPVYALYHQGVNEVLIGVHPRHAKFYSRLLHFEVAGPIRRYRLVQERPVVLLRFDLAKLDASDPVGRGLQHWRERRLEADAFASRFKFALRDVAASVLPRYLRWMQHGDAEPIRIARWRGE